MGKRTSKSLVLEVVDIKGHCPVYRKGGLVEIQVLDSDIARFADPQPTRIDQLKEYLVAALLVEPPP